MNIVIAKLGKSINFNKNKWGAIGGDNEAPMLFKNIINRNPDKTFYIIGRNDLKEFSKEDQKLLFPHNNVVDIWENWRTSRVDKNIIEYPFVPHEWIIQMLKNVTIDAGLIMCGMGSQHCNVPNRIIKSDGSGDFATPLATMRNYVAPLVHYLNRSKIPYMTLSPDPRYFPFRGKDLFHREEFSLSQINGDFTIKHLRNYDEQVKVSSTIPAYYSKLETTFLIDQKPINKKIQKTDFINVVLNEVHNNRGKGGQVASSGRYPYLKDYILDNFSDVKIFGKWPEDEIGNDSRFKGTVKFSQLHEKLVNTKYTWMFPPEFGWATSKYWEMAYYQIIPFMHKTYDSQKNIPCPDYLRVESSQEFKEKIQELENNPKKYQQVLDEIQDTLTWDLFTGKYLNDIVIKNLSYLTGKELDTDSRNEYVNDIDEKEKKTLF